MNNNRKLLAGFFIIIILGLFIWIMIVQWSKVSTILSFILYGIVLAYLLVPVSRWIEKFMPRSWAVIILYLTIIVILTASILLLMPTLIRQMTALLERLPGLAAKTKNIIGNLQVWLEDAGLPSSIIAALNQLVEEMEEGLVAGLKNVIDGALGEVDRIGGLFTVPVLSFYFIKDREYFKKVILGLIPSNIKGNVLQISGQVNKILNQFIRGQLLVALVVGIMTAIGYWFIGLPYPMVLGLIAGIFEIVPYFGPFLGAFPAVLIAVLNFPSKLIWTIVVAIIAQQLEGNIITPKIMGDHVGLHPVYIIVALWIGGFFFGILGMLFAVPITLILRVILKNIYFSIVSIPWQPEK